MADLYQNIPELQAQAQVNEQKRRIAEAMMAQGLEQQQPYSSAGRYVVPMSWTQGLNKVAQALLGAYGVKKAQQGEEDIASRLTEGQKKAYEAYTQGLSAPKAMTPAALRPEGVALAETQQPQIGTMQSLTQQAEPTPQVAPATQPTEQDMMANSDAARANMERFIGDPYANPKQVQAAIYADTSRRSDEGEAANRAVLRQNKLDELEQRMEAAKLRSEDVRFSAQQRADALREAAALRLEIAQMAGSMRGQARLGTDQRYTENGDVEIIPGSKTYRTQADKHANDVNTRKLARSKADIGIAAIDYILDPKNKDGFESNFGGYNAYVSSRVPGDATANVRNKIESLKSSMKMAGLELIRSGGSIGQMTEREWPIVQDMIDRIDSTLGEDQAKSILEDIKVYLESLKTKADEVYQQEWGGSQFYKNDAPDKDSPPAGLGGKTIVRRGKEKGTGRTVIEYSDGTTAYGD